MRLVTLALSTLFLLFAFRGTAHAVIDPLSVANNKFGIHLIDENGLEDASKLVNSSGGDWGYVTIVIREDQRDVQRWNRTFNKMEELHLIPLIRIATSQGINGWTQPEIADIDNWVTFLDSLDWFTPNRYIIVGNEVNYIGEWGGEINPEEYTDYLVLVSNALKDASEDFFILPAGLDASAPNSPEYMDEELFLTRMYSHNKKVFEKIDGWTSHSYPNPGFSGSVDDTGRGTVRTFEWELELVKSLGFTGKLPVFITETGWVTSNLSDKEISENLRIAFTSVWKDKRIVAVTPFILDYPGEPFEKFSWKDKEGNFRKSYFDLQTIRKVSGRPNYVKNEKNQVMEITQLVYNIYHNIWTS